MKNLSFKKLSLVAGLFLAVFLTACGGGSDPATIDFTVDAPQFRTDFNKAAANMSLGITMGEMSTGLENGDRVLTATVTSDSSSMTSAVKTYLGATEKINRVKIGIKATAGDAEEKGYVMGLAIKAAMKALDPSLTEEKIGELFLYLNNDLNFYKTSDTANKPYNKRKYVLSFSETNGVATMDFTIYALDR